MPNVLFYVKAPEPQWVSYLNNTYWEPGRWYNPSFGPDGSWNGSGWDSTTNTTPPQTCAVGLETINNWETGLRPTKMRITFISGDGSNVSVRLRDTADNEIFVDSLGVTSGEELTLDWSNNLDMFNLQTYDNSCSLGYEITNIEFYL